MTNYTQHVSKKTRHLISVHKMDKYKLLNYFIVIFPKKSCMYIVKMTINVLILILQFANQTGPKINLCDTVCMILCLAILEH